MKRMMILAVAALLATGCAEIHKLAEEKKNPYEKPFYAKYLNTGSALDAEIQRVVEALRTDPTNAELHNDLGAMLMQKGFPKDAAREFQRSVRHDRRYVPAWYNLGLVHAAMGDELAARHAFYKTIRLKPGHSAALFQLGLIEEKRHHTDRAIALYAKAFAINPSLLEVEVNPRILDSSLVDLALLRLYQTDHAKKTMQFQDAPFFAGANGRPSAASRASEAPSPQPPPASIVPPAAPDTDPGAQNNAQPQRRRRPGTPATDQPPQNPPS